MLHRDIADLVNADFAVVSLPVSCDNPETNLTMHVTMPSTFGSKSTAAGARPLAQHIHTMLLSEFGPHDLVQLGAAPAASTCRAAGRRFARTLPWVLALHQAMESARPIALHSCMHHGLASIRAVCRAVATSLRAGSRRNTPPCGVLAVSRGAILEGNDAWWQWAARQRAPDQLCASLVRQACAAPLGRHGWGGVHAPHAGAAASDDAQQLLFAQKRLWLPGPLGDSPHEQRLLTVVPLSIAVRERQHPVPPRRQLRPAAQQASGSGDSSLLRPVLSTAGSVTSIRLLVIEAVPPSDHAPPPRAAGGGGDHPAPTSPAARPEVSIQSLHRASAPSASPMRAHTAVRIAEAVANTPPAEAEAAVACLSELDRGMAVTSDTNEPRQHHVPPSWTCGGEVRSVEGGLAVEAALQRQALSKPQDGSQEESQQLFCDHVVSVALRAVARRNLATDMHLAGATAGGAAGGDVLPSWCLLPSAPWTLPVEALLAPEGKVPLLALIASHSGDGSSTPPLLSMWASPQRPPPASVLKRVVEWQFTELPAQAVDACMHLEDGTSFIKVRCSDRVHVTAVLHPPPTLPTFVPLHIARALAEAVTGSAWDVFAVKRSVPSQQRLAEGQSQRVPALSTLVCPAWYSPSDGSGASSTVLSLVAAGHAAWA